MTYDLSWQELSLNSATLLLHQLKKIIIILILGGRKCKEAPRIMLIQNHKYNNSSFFKWQLFFAIKSPYHTLSLHDKDNYGEWTMDNTLTNQNATTADEKVSVVNLFKDETGCV
jgi:hypothetical protein